jgi:hypothetical protein
LPAGEAPALQTIVEALLRALFEEGGHARWKSPGRLLPVRPKRQAELRAQRKGILFFSETVRIFSLCKK